MNDQSDCGFAKPKPGPHVCNALCQSDCLVQRLKEQLAGAAKVLEIVQGQTTIPGITALIAQRLQIIHESGVLQEESPAHVQPVILQRKDARQIWLVERSDCAFSVYFEESRALNEAEDGEIVFQAGLVPIGRIRRTLEQV